MKTVSALAIAASLALGSLAFAPAADAATTMKKPAATTACMTKDKKPCVKHVTKIHKHKKVAAKTPVKTDAKAPAKKAS